jgi:hypothetical protein
MIHRHWLGWSGERSEARAALRFAAVVLVLPIVACGQYQEDPAPGSGAGGTSGSAATSGGTDASGGTAGTGNVAGTGAGGTDTAGSGGSAGTGTSQPPPEPSCEAVTACAGDPAGVWFAQKSCLPVSGEADVSELGIGCNSAPISGKIDVTGNFTIGADMSISDNTTTSGELIIELAPPCLDVSGTVTECAKIGIPLASGGFDTVECVDSQETMGGCTCTGKFTQSGGMGYILAFNAATSGTYTAANNTLTVKGTSTAAHLETLDYAHCVDGNFMMVTPTTTTKLGTTTGTIVLQKQP